MLTTYFQDSFLLAYVITGLKFRYILSLQWIVHS